MLATMADELDGCPEPTLTFWRDYAASVEAGVPAVETFSITLFRSSTEALEDYWEHGKGAAKIRWGTDGAMKRCIRQVKLHTHMADPGGYCATRHKHVTGEWPTTHGDKGIPS